ncbi:MAG: hypothetical protein JST83_10725 [Bacteroidetes bacterium]|nr:hypothetical protein [Bacteroidota bacterium]
MRRIVFVLVIASLCLCAMAQAPAPAWTITKDNATHTTVHHSSIDEIVKVRNAFGRRGEFLYIEPRVTIRNGVVDHLGPTGVLDVRENYYKAKLIGYVQYDGSYRERELFFNSKGQIFLELRYDKGQQMYRNDSVRPASVLSIPAKINHDITSK